MSIESSAVSIDCLKLIGCLLNRGSFMFSSTKIVLHYVFVLCTVPIMSCKKGLKSQLDRVLS